MRIPKEVWAKYAVTDADTALFLDYFDEPSGGKILEVGAHDEPVANMLSELGYAVTGVDLREYNPDQDSGKKHDGSLPCNYEYVRADFCDLPLDFLRERLGTYDIAVSLSALEHFGLTTYGEGAPHPYYDVIAARTMWSLLKEGGAAYLTVPLGAKFLEAGTHWRVYDVASLQSRLVQDFRIELVIPVIAAPCEIKGQSRKGGEPITWEEACSYPGEPPHVSVLLKLRKVRVGRRAPDGR